MHAVIVRWGLQTGSRFTVDRFCSVSRSTMTRSVSKSSGVEDVRKGAWTAEEDEKLRKYVETYGTGHWRSVGKKAGTSKNR